MRDPLKGRQFNRSIYFDLCDISVKTLKPEVSAFGRRRQLQMACGSGKVQGRAGFENMSIPADLCSQTKTNAGVDMFSVVSGGYLTPQLLIGATSRSR